MTTGYDPQEIKTSQPLRACPFCGGEAHFDDDGEFQSVGCGACDFSICDSALGGADVVKHWNGRADVADEPLIKKLMAASDTLSRGAAEQAIRIVREHDRKVEIQETSEQVFDRVWDEEFWGIRR